jgi:hypothetical protein
MIQAPKSTLEESTEGAEEQEVGLPLAAVLVKRRRLELARTDMLRQLDLARAEPHREMLRRALSALEQELDRLI